MVSRNNVGVTYSKMSCVQYSIQSMMPSVMGMPADADVVRCSNYGSTGGSYPNQPNGLRSQFSDTVIQIGRASCRERV